MNPDTLNLADAEAVWLILRSRVRGSNRVPSQSHIWPHRAHVATSLHHKTLNLTAQKQYGWFLEAAPEDIAYLARATLLALAAQPRRAGRACGAGAGHPAAAPGAVRPHRGACPQNPENLNLLKPKRCAWVRMLACVPGVPAILRQDCCTTSLRCVPQEAPNPDTARADRARSGLVPGIPLQSWTLHDLTEAHWSQTPIPLPANAACYCGCGCWASRCTF